ncbi:MAG: tetratricopeptide repeat protein, partial [Caldilineaceae bacterium]|nr:tetratricopeptide repeat protein [Caldilineaceae bacterium]
AYAAALSQLTTLYEERRDYRQAIRHALALLRHDPLHESAYAQLMRLHALNDDRAAALHTYHTCATLLRRELDVEPGPTTRQLYERLLSAPQPVAPAQVGLAIPLVGREAEWAQLLEAWHEATGSARLALLTGEAGIGKTRLVEALVEWVSRQGIPALVARCYAAGGELPYAAVVSWLRSQPLPPLADPWLRELARLLPEILVEHPNLLSPAPLTEMWQRLHLFEALAHALLDGRNALLLFLDDLQWCDRDTLDWLQYLLTTRPANSVQPQLLIVATLRSEESAANPALAAQLAQWQAEFIRARQLTEIELGPLSENATLALADRVAGRPFDRALGPLLYQSTEGHPLFIVEMVRAGFSRESKQMLSVNHAANALRDASTLPARVRQVLTARLGQLSPTARGVVELAAVVGRAFTYGVLIGATDLSEELLVMALDECWQKRIIREQSEDAYDFSHDKLREVAYAGLSQTRRRWLHGRVAQALEQAHAADMDSVSGQIAAHYEHAGKPQSAITFYRRAATLSHRIYANDEAIKLYQYMLQGELGKILSAADICAIKLALGEVWRVNGQWAQAQSINQEVLAAAESMGNVALEAQAQRALADVLRLQGHYDSALEWLARAELAFEAIKDWRGVVSALWTMGEVYWFKGDHKRALASLEQQLQIATENDDQRGVCEALDTMGMIYWSQGDWDQSMNCCLRSIAIAEPLGYHLVITRAAITIGNVYSSQRAVGDAVHWYLRAGLLARQIDDRQVLSWAFSNIAEVLAACGYHRHALHGHERATQISFVIGDRWTTCLNIFSLGVDTEALQKLEQAEYLYRKAISIGRRLDIPSYLSGMVIQLSRFLLEQGRVSEAHSLYHEALTLISRVEGDRLAGEDTRFDTQVLGIRLQHALGLLTGSAAVTELQALLNQTASPAQQTVINYEIWRLTPNDEGTRFAAVALCRSQHALTGAYEYQRRYHELTGEMLPEPPDLPDVSELIPAAPVDLDGLLERLEPTLAGLDASFA